MSLQVLKLDDLKRQKHKLLSKLASKLWQGFFPDDTETLYLMEVDLESTEDGEGLQAEHICPL